MRLFRSDKLSFGGELSNPAQRIEACGDIRMRPEMEYRSFPIEGLSLLAETETLAVLADGNQTFSRALDEIARQGFLTGGGATTCLPDDASPSERETAAYIWRVLDEAVVEDGVAEACDPGAERRRVGAAIGYLSKHHLELTAKLVIAGGMAGDWVRAHQDEIRARAQETRRLWREMRSESAKA